jgi:hypothetical protein
MIRWPFISAPRRARALGVLLLGMASQVAAEEMAADDFERPRHLVRLEIATEDLEALRKESRQWVPAYWSDGISKRLKVALRLKGRLGSFRSVDDKPSWTVDFDQLVPGQRWHKLSRLYLNNSVEDPSYQHEWIGTRLYRSAGLPAPRVAHALVTANSRELGLYVLKEGFTKELWGSAASPSALFEPEPGPGCDVDGPMKLNWGETAVARGPLQELAAAAAEPQPAERWARLGRWLDRDRFLTFIALETLIGHRDGYAQARNNYRLSYHHEGRSGQFTFVPSGMDRLFARADAPLKPRFSGVVAQAIVTTEEGQAAYQAHLRAAFTNHLQTQPWSQWILSNARFLREGMSPRDSAALHVATTDLVARVERRIISIGRQLAEPPLVPLKLEHGRVALTNWQALDPPEGGRLDRVIEQGRSCLRIVAGPLTSASWQTRIQLHPGRYRFTAQVRTRAVAPLPFGKNHGATLSVNGQPDASPWLRGDAGWASLQMDFVVGPADPEVDLRCVLRASAGQAWFDQTTLQLVPQPKPEETQ